MTYEWRDGYAKLKQDERSELHLIINGNTEQLPYLPPQQSTVSTDLPLLSTITISTVYDWHFKLYNCLN